MLSQSVELALQAREEKMQVQPILVVTQDAGLWQSWQLLAQSGKTPYRGVGMQDMLNWKNRGHRLVIVDMALLKQGCAEEQWSTYFDGLCVLVLSAHMSDAEGQLVLAKGASGYAHSHSSMESLALIVSSLESGAIWLGRSLLQKMLHDIDQRLPVAMDNHWAQPLSVREAEVARLAAVGYSNAEIAQKLLITERTVRAHLSAVFDKLHVDDRLQLALKVHGIRR
ncbi:helix-turn-helix transcriptional regulator [Comamonas jiangduensis]|jgi:DNA-binding NarL/FixJ family response regulator|uniref:helix-turn-helix transcriptional regulator n=3 Tax=Comamonas jiangduensis TaxID=1194168 RepID=UPI003BF78E42